MATIAAPGTLLLNWVDVGILSAGGFQQGAYLFLVVFVYPAICLVKGWRVVPLAGVACGAIGVLLCGAYIASKRVQMFSESVNAAGAGPYAFLLASLGLIAGSLLQGKRGQGAGPGRRRVVEGPPPTGEARTGDGSTPQGGPRSSSSSTRHRAVPRRALPPRGRGRALLVAGALLLLLIGAGVLLLPALRDSGATHSVGKPARLFFGDVELTPDLGGALFFDKHGIERSGAEHAVLEAGTRIRALKRTIRTSERRSGTHLSNLETHTLYFVEVLNGAHAGKRGWMNDHLLLPETR